MILSNSVKATFYLNLCHNIFKHGRQHINDESHIFHHVLIYLNQKKHSSNEFKQKLSVLPSMDENECVPYLIFMIDVLKMMTLMEDGNNIFMDQIIIDDYFISTLSQFWYHSHITVVRKSLELTTRIIKHYSNKKQLNLKILTHLITFINYCQSNLSSSHLQLLQDHDRTEFFYQPLFNDPQNETSLTIDRESLNMLIQLIITSINNLIQYDINDIPVAIKLSLDETMTSFLVPIQSSIDALDFIFNICGSNDQSTIKLQLDILNIHILLEQQSFMTVVTNSYMSWSNLFSPLFNHINPHKLFLYFLQRTGMDYELIIDLLISNETDMLLFLVKYLKFIEQHPSTFINTFHQLFMHDKHNKYESEDEEIEEENDDDDETIYSFISLLYQIINILQSNVFPYNASVLARRIYSVIQCLQQNMIE
ncbi:unnamed protein product [Cunninghamella blakesleeana]